MTRITPPTHRFAAIAGPAAALCLGTASVAAAATVQPLVLRNVTVVDTRTGALATGRSIVVEDGRIARVEAAEGYLPDASARVVDATGKYVVPGYNDMHSHLLSYGDRARNQALMLANGVTGFRQMNGTPELVAASKAGDDLTPGDGPDVVQLASVILNGGSMRSVEDAVRLVNEQATAGGDFIKLTEAPPPAFLAALTEAERLGLQNGGHFPSILSTEQVVGAGMDVFEHLGAGEGLPLEASTAEEALRASIAAEPPSPPPSDILRFLANPTAFASDEYFARVSTMVDTFDEGKAREVAAFLAANGVWQVPTLIRLRTINLGDAPEYRDDPNLAYVTDAERTRWQGVADAFAANLPEGFDQADLAALVDFQLRTVGILNEAGVPILAGSDYGGGFLVPGFSLHQEFALLSEAGLSPLEVLQSTTLTAATFLGREGVMGNVLAGMDADLVLLDANPLDGVANLQSIFGVVQDGTYHGPRELDAFLGEPSPVPSPVPVPVPGAGLLLLSGLGLAGAMRLRRPIRRRA